MDYKRGGVTFFDPDGRIVGDDNTRFRVIVRQKPNPIGFTAKLPGDRRSFIQH